MAIRFTAYGVAKPQGSQESRFVPSLGRTVSHEKKSVYQWRSVIAAAAVRVLPGGFELLEGPIAFEAVFYRPRPKKPKPTARVWPTTPPDLDKLLRAAADALCGVVFRDDGQIVTFAGSRKAYGVPARVEVRISEIRDGEEGA